MSYGHYETVIGFQEYGPGRYTHRKGIMMENSWVSRMVRELQEFNTVTKSEFILRYRPHLSKSDVTRGGWGTSMWTSLVDSGVIQETPYRRNRQKVWVRGPEFDKYENLRKFFSEYGQCDWDEVEYLRVHPDEFDTPEEFELFQTFFKRDTPHRHFVYDV